MSELATPDPWRTLRELTSARIALGHVGASLPTAAHLEFQLAHARARDAVHAALDAGVVTSALADSGHDVVRVHSAAAERTSYLQRPDLGRRLDESSRARLAAFAPGGYDAAFVIADGLSALAVERHAAPVCLRAMVSLEEEGWRLAPIVLVEQGRVAIGDEIASVLGAELVAVLIGERPGLSAPDSLGVYVTYGARPGTRDADRNCISNIRAEGLGHAEAARRLVQLLREARRRRLTGVALKGELPRSPTTDVRRLPTAD